MKIYIFDILEFLKIHCSKRKGYFLMFIIEKSFSRENQISIYEISNFSLVDFEALKS